MRSFFVSSTLSRSQDGRSCAKTRWAFAEKFDFGRKCLEICCDLGKFLGQKQPITSLKKLGTSCFGPFSAFFWLWKGPLASGQEVHYFMVYTAYYAELIFQICNYAQKRRMCRKNSKYDSIATVGEIRVWWRANFQSGSRVLKKVF